MAQVKLPRRHSSIFVFFPTSDAAHDLVQPSGHCGLYIYSKMILKTEYDISF